MRPVSEKPAISTNGTLKGTNEKFATSEKRITKLCKCDGVFEAHKSEDAFLTKA